MPHMYLHLREGGQLLPDPDGADYPDLATAELAALAGLRDIAAESLKWGTPVESRAIVIANAEGNTLATVTLPDAIKGILDC